MDNYRIIISIDLAINATGWCIFKKDVGGHGIADEMLMRGTIFKKVKTTDLNVIAADLSSQINEQLIKATTFLQIVKEAEYVDIVVECNLSTWKFIYLSGYIISSILNKCNLAVDQIKLVQANDWYQHIGSLSDKREKRKEISLECATEYGGEPEDDNQADAFNMAILYNKLYDLCKKKILNQKEVELKKLTRKAKNTKKEYLKNRYLKKIRNLKQSIEGLRDKTWD